MSRDSDLRLYVEFNNVNKFTNNIKSLSPDITRPLYLFQNSLHPIHIKNSTGDLDENYVVIYLNND